MMLANRGASQCSVVAIQGTRRLFGESTFRIDQHSPLMTSLTHPGCLYRDINAPVPWSLTIADLMLRRVREKIGMDNIRHAGTSAAPISPDVMAFIHSLNIPVFEVGRQRSLIFLWCRGEGCVSCIQLSVNIMKTNMDDWK